MIINMRGCDLCTDSIECFNMICCYKENIAALIIATLLAYINNNFHILFISNPFTKKFHVCYHSLNPSHIIFVDMWERMFRQRLIIAELLSYVWDVIWAILEASGGDAIYTDACVQVITEVSIVYSLVEYMFGGGYEAAINLHSLRRSHRSNFVFLDGP